MGFVPITNDNNSKDGFKSSKIKKKPIYDARKAIEETKEPEKKEEIVEEIKEQDKKEEIVEKIKEPEKKEEVIQETKEPEKKEEIIQEIVDPEKKEEILEEKKEIEKNDTMEIMQLVKVQIIENTKNKSVEKKKYAIAFQKK